MKTLFREGKNYHFFFCSPDSIARIEASKKPYYDHALESFPRLPSLVSESLLIPKFLYSLLYDRVHYETNSYFSFESLGSSSQPKTIQRKEDFFTIHGLGKIEEKILYQDKRQKRDSVRYLSLRDIVNPNFSEIEVLSEIEKLYFDPDTKSSLYQLVKILYAGTPNEELQLISRLFTDEPEFAIFLRDSLFKIEILPLVHGIFLQNCLNSLDERIIKNAIPRLSPGVRAVIQKSVSKNKFKSIMESPHYQPEKGNTLEEIIEEEIYKKFSRNVYYDKENINVYWDREEKKDLLYESIFKFQECKKMNFTFNQPFIEFYGFDGVNIFIKLLESMEVLRFDLFLSKKELETLEFHKLPKDIIIQIPYYPTHRIILGGGISSGKNHLEFMIQFFEY
jgi:hypothetical protein